MTAGSDDSKVRSWLNSGKMPQRCPFLRAFYCLRTELCSAGPAVYDCNDAVFVSLYHRRLNELKRGGTL